MLALTDNVPPVGDQGENGGVARSRCGPAVRHLADGGRAEPAGGRRVPAEEPDRRRAGDADRLLHTTSTHSDYDSAYAQEAVATSPDANLKKWIAGVDSSQDGLPENFNSRRHRHRRSVLQVVRQGDEQRCCRTSTWRFAAPKTAVHGTDKQTCTDWTLRYSFELVNGVPLIKSALPPPGVASGQEACPSPANAVNSAAPSSPVGSVVSSPASSP